ncbi:MAG: glycerol-3-phosphate 1-O-acyltransferase PlsY [Kiritimatiellae bacterium]|nr:glycerol-3-phosphate 1-O-acyltransferase PlsY [Kiritimatiellia bacterium]
MKTIILTAIFSYIIGSIPFGYLAGLTKGVDIRTLGSKNIGATNVFRNLGKKLGIITFILDMLKGVTAVVVIPCAVKYFFGEEPNLDEAYVVITGAVSVLIGHSFPFTLGFKGGKGVATGLGLAIGIAPISALTGFVLWAIIFRASGYVSLASIIAAIYVAIGTWFIDYASADNCIIQITITLLATLIVIKHKSNIQRLINGCENRFSFKKDK